MSFTAMPNAISYTTTSLSFTFISLVYEGKGFFFTFYINLDYIFLYTKTHHVTSPEVANYLNYVSVGTCQKNVKGKVQIQLLF